MRKRRWGKRIRMRFAHRPEKLLWLIILPGGMLPGVRALNGYVWW